MDSGALPDLEDGGLPDMDANVGGDGQVEMDGASMMDARLDGTVPDGATGPSCNLAPDAGTCPTGFDVVDGCCVDHDDCAPGGAGDMCTSMAGAYCVNTPGSYRCDCVLGERLVNGACVDIDECMEGLDDCATGVTCTNVAGPGRYTCGDCIAGTTGGANGACTNVDECQFDNACAPSAICDDLTPTTGDPRTHVCTCPNGYNTAADGTSCEDIDECAANNGVGACPPGSMCSNTPGSYTCTCNPGSEFTNAGGVPACIDVNECVTGDNTCDPRVACTNTSPSYTCEACPTGYDGASGSGAGCTDIDECQATINPCGGALNCLNVPGGFDCVAACPTGMDTSNRVCNDPDECNNPNPMFLPACSASAECTNFDWPTKYTCSCPLGTAGIALENFGSEPMPAGCVATGMDVPTLTFASGHRHVCSVVADGPMGLSGHLACAGDPASPASTLPAPAAGQTALADDDTFVEVANGNDFSCARRIDDTVACWGSNPFGQAPRSRAGHYVALAAGDRNVCGLLDDRTINCWGRNDRGQNMAPTGTYRAIALGSEHGCAVSGDREVVCWGGNGDGRATPPGPVNADNNILQIALGAEHSCALDTDGDVLCWGVAASGQTNVPASTKFAQIAAGGDFTCGVRSDHTVTCWGDPANPAVANAPASGTFTGLVAGRTYACAAAIADGNVVCWGTVPAGLFP